jgi:hypothetical protein
MLFVPSASLLNPLIPELNPICYLLALLAHDFLHVSRIRVNEDGGRKYTFASISVPPLTSRYKP